MLDLGDGLVDLPFQGWGVGALVLVEVGADVGTDGEACGNWEANSGHFGEVGPFAAEEGLHLAVTIRFAATKGVNVLHRLAKEWFLRFRRLCFSWHGVKWSENKCQPIGFFASLIRLVLREGEKRVGEISRKILGRRRPFLSLVPRG